MRKAIILTNLAFAATLILAMLYGHFMVTTNTCLRLATIDRAGGFNIEKLKSIPQANLADVRGEGMMNYVCGPWMNWADLLCVLGVFACMANLAILALHPTKTAAS